MSCVRLLPPEAVVAAPVTLSASPAGDSHLRLEVAWKAPGCRVLRSAFLDVVYVPLRRLGVMPAARHARSAS